MVFTSSDHVALQVTTGLERAQNKGVFTGVSIHNVLTTVDHMVHNALRNPNPQSPGEPDHEHDSDDSDGTVDDYEEFSDDEAAFNLPSRQRPTLALSQKLRHDLRLAKAAGFKVGYLGSKTGPIILSIARRISRLGISEEAMQVWSVQPSEYLVLLIRYPNGYQDMQGIFEMSESAALCVQMRIGLYDSYKPSSFKAALLAFQAHSTSVTSDEHSFKSRDTNSMTSLRPMFIGSQLNKLLNERLLEIIRLRKRYDISWTGAEFFFHANQGKAIGAGDPSDPEFYVQDTWATPPPGVLTSDHYLEMRLDMIETSFPLVAMQFTLRHFVKCTEFCLVCHCKTFDNFEALKPYVCSKGLCLFQYMSLGMGPSLEHEIRTQPFVVDLLVSLAYARAEAGHLQDFPTGLGIMVPDEDNIPLKKKPAELLGSSSYYTGLLSKSSMTVFCEVSGIVAGDWITIVRTVDSQIRAYHCRVEHVGESLGYFTISQSIPSGNKDLLTAHLLEDTEVNFVRYDQNFDDMKPQMKQTVMLRILDTLPSIELMSQFLEPPGSEKVLSSWRERITPAALNLLRWIVASNRSCILQDRDDPNHLVSQMPGYMQFRLVQGAPDKEQRFIKAVNSVSMVENPKYPTLFAWHGSPASNWHSILREGLNFDKIANGRACGNGVYFSSCYSTSAGYSADRGNTGLSNWPHSTLNLSSVLSLNEIVNKPSSFVCTRPHLVVQHLDWIQTRYLFVRYHKGVECRLPNVQKSDYLPFHSQDPRYPVIGSNGKHVTIPLSAVSSQRRQLSCKSALASSPKKSSQIRKVPAKTCTSSKSTTDNGGFIGHDDDRASISTATTDLNLLLSDLETQDGTTQTTIETSSDENVQTATSLVQSAPETDFVSGTLKADCLPLIAPPQYATTMATKSLQQHLQATLRTQKKEALAELGWSVDPNLISTVYQWIVEMHSFDSALPLAHDLKAAKLNSIVLELRFPTEFPMNPPFVRIIRPRFLEFAAGGGGHVTAGGAMCIELLTTSGWSPVTSIESVLLQVRLALSTTEPRPARLARGTRRDYGIGEAVAAFRRACLSHGWQVPSDLELIKG